MGKIIVSENVTLDGVVQDPAGVEGFRHGGWVGRIGDRGRDARRIAWHILEHAWEMQDRAESQAVQPTRTSPVS